MSRRGLETGFAYLTLVVLIIYVPVETWISWSDGLLDPYYLIDAIAMGLLLWGALRSLRARPKPSPEVMCIACAWAAANGWRAALWRLDVVRAGDTLTFGMAEMWSVGIGTLLALLLFVVLLALVVLNQRVERDVGA